MQDKPESNRRRRLGPITLIVVLLIAVGMDGCGIGKLPRPGPDWLYGSNVGLWLGGSPARRAPSPGYGFADQMWHQFRMHSVIGTFLTRLTRVHVGDSTPDPTFDVIEMIDEEFLTRHPWMIPSVQSGRVLYQSNNAEQFWLFEARERDDYTVRRGLARNELNRWTWALIQVGVLVGIAGLYFIAGRIRRLRSMGNTGAISLWAMLMERARSRNAMQIERRLKALRDESAAVADNPEALERVRSQIAWWEGRLHKCYSVLDELRRMRPERQSDSDSSS